MHLTPTLCVVHSIVNTFLLCFLQKSYLLLTHTMRVKCPTKILSSMLSAKILHEFDIHTFRAKCDRKILFSMLSAKKLHAFDIHTKRVICPNKILSSMISAKKSYVYLTPSLCVLNALILSYNYL
jgi:hypothetical protein